LRLNPLLLCDYVEVGSTPGRLWKYHAPYRLIVWALGYRALDVLILLALQGRWFFGLALIYAQPFGIAHLPARGNVEFRGLLPNAYRPHQEG